MPQLNGYAKRVDSTQTDSGQRSNLFLEKAKRFTAMDRGAIEHNMDATATIFEDNERVRVTEWRFEVGEETGWHRHELDYTVVPISTGTLTIVDRSGIETPNSISLGVPYFRYSGAEHNVINRGSENMSFIEVELKPQLS